MSSESSVRKMPYRLLGPTGLKVSALSFGAWVTFKSQVDVEKAYELMRAAYEAGINFFDNAEVYADGEAERIMGLSIQRGVAEKVWDREDLVVSTKVFFGHSGKKGPNSKGLSRKHVVEGVERALERLQLSYVDLVFCHRPDPLTPMEETVRAMHHVIERGWAFYWGTSEWSAQQLTEALQIADRLGLHRPVMEQPQYNLFVRHRVEVEYLPLYRSAGLGLTTWSPLASGVLTGKYAAGPDALPEGSRLALPEYKWLRDSKFSGANAWQIPRAERLRPIANDLGCSMAQLALAWCLSNQRVSTVILGATSLQQLHENLSALDILPKLTPDVLARIDQELDTKPKLDETTIYVNSLRNLD
eukprot:TRINITY_DN1791_c0_g2_i2.p1 TRINITY_DN1791_c0_g2~~TRINITY_DN1791_c0_g2_i2.p1  ORF type:complete len:359 (+),score=44.36 TRINITY_DN1791_c0_g2_i2:74-1150(+)